MRTARPAAFAVLTAAFAGTPASAQFADTASVEAHMAGEWCSAEDGLRVAFDADARTVTLDWEGEPPLAFGYDVSLVDGDEFGIDLMEGDALTAMTVYGGTQGVEMDVYGDADPVPVTRCE